MALTISPGRWGKTTPSLNKAQLNMNQTIWFLWDMWKTPTQPSRSLVDSTEPQKGHIDKDPVEIVLKPHQNKEHQVRKVWGKEFDSRPALNPAPESSCAHFLVGWRNIIRAQIYACSFVFWGKYIFWNARSYSYSSILYFRGTNYYWIQFEQVKRTLSGSYTVTVLISGELM